MEMGISMTGRNLTSDDVLNLATKEELAGKASIPDLRAVEAAMSCKYATVQDLNFSVAALKNLLNDYTTVAFVDNIVNEMLPAAVRAEADRRWGIRKKLIKNVIFWTGVTVSSVTSYELLRNVVLAAFRLIHG